jgi:hypothetical protein
MSDESQAQRPRLKVTFESAGIVRGGDIGAAEIYFEGWVDDGGGKKRWRLPKNGYIPDVKDGQTIELDAVVYEGRLQGHELHVHFEAWDEDLGRDRALKPDDLLGIYDREFGEKQRYGVGRHASIPLKTDAGEWMLTFRVEEV